MCAVPEVTQPQLSACATPQPAPMRFPSLLIHNDQQMGSSIGARWVTGSWQALPCSTPFPPPTGWP